MSRQSHLPPRSPIQTKNKTFPSQNSLSSSSPNYPFTPRHQNSVSESFVLEEQPPWLDEILRETNENSKSTPIRRSVSDSITLLGGFIDDESLGSNESGGGLESSYVYGPNSPRRRENMASSENIVVSKLNDYFSSSATLRSNNILRKSEIVRPNRIGEAGSAGMANFETTEIKRHSGQRSRVRKLHHIAELERTVDVLQNLESELAMKVATLRQLCIDLSTENNTIKQKLTGLGQEKAFLEGQYRSLRTELDRLRNNSACLVEGNCSTDFKPSSVKKEESLEAIWEMLDIRKLDLNR